MILLLFVVKESDACRRHQKVADPPWMAKLGEAVPGKVFLFNISSRAVLLAEVRSEISNTYPSHKNIV